MASCSPSLIQAELNSERSKLLCIGRDEGWIAPIRECLDERIAPIALSGKEAVRLKLPDAPVVILDAGMDALCFNAILTRLTDCSPTPMILILGQDLSMPRSLKSMTRAACIRYLPESVLSGGLLQQMIEDGLERHRLHAAEETLTRELENAQIQLRELRHLATDHTVDNTTALLRLYHTVSSLNGLSRVEEVAKFVVTSAAGMVRSRRVSLLMPDANREYLTVVASLGIEPDLITRTRIQIGAGICGEVFAQSRQLLIPYGRIPATWINRADDELIPRAPLISLVLSGPDRPLAVLNVSEPIDAQAYNEQSLAGLQTLSETAAIVLANHIRGQERDEARDSIMIALAKLAESRDPETGKHLERVQIYCRLLAEDLAKLPKFKETITPDFIETLVRSSPLHDIGKVGVPDHILLKPGRLTAEEFELMKQHTLIGGDTIKTLFKQGRQCEFLEMAMQIAYHHHEKYDGSGYPFGLQSETIPLSARILAVADVYDAMTTTRVYKKAAPHAEARAIILQGRGSHFDPQVVDAFTRCEGEFNKLAINLADIIGGTPLR